MTIDKAKLRALAEKTTPACEWYKPGDLRYADDKTGEIHGLHHDDDSFIAAANPATILALLDEIERLERKNANQVETIRQYQDHLLGGDSILSLTNENEKFDEGMRALACQLGAGGYNAETLTAEQLVAKVTDGLAVFAESSGRLLDGVRAENEALRKIISESATACGAAVSVECSLEFMAMLPSEIASVIRGLRKDAARLTWLDESQEVDSVGPTLCCGKHRATLREAIDAAMAMEARHG